MPRHIKNTRAKLERDRARALEAFKAALPDDYEKFCVAEAGLKALGPVETRYARELKDPDAITACLEYEERWLTPRQIANLLHAGGYPMDAERGIGLLVQNIGKHVIRGNYQEVAGKVGLLAWKYPDTV